MKSSVPTVSQEEDASLGTEGVAAPRRAYGYVRVSTSRQAEHETSLADQMVSIERYCAQRNIELVGIHREAGASATDDSRPAFRQMIEGATAGARPVDLIIVHSFSRFFRDQFEFERYRRLLQRAKVEVVSITQDVGEGHMADLIRSILNKFDEYQSQENAKHVKRSMAANARDGFWNGSRPPLGYTTEVVERRRDKEKKRLVIDDREALLVRRIFDLYLHGDGQSGAMGVKKIVSHLNGNGHSYRGKPFHTSNVDAVLRRTTYCETHFYNQRDSRTGERRPRAEWVPVEVPAIISQTDFDLVQTRLTERNPKQTPPRVVSGPTLLIGLARCKCGGALTIRTGKSGAYRYYACSSRARLGAMACKGQSIRMEKLDGTVLGALEHELLKRDRLTELLQAFLDHSDAAVGKRLQELQLLRTQRTEAEGAINRLYALVEQGVVLPSDSTFGSRLTQQRLKLDQLAADIDNLDAQLRSSTHRITPEIITRFTELVRSTLHGTDPALRQGYVRLLVDAVHLDGDQVRITGSKKALERAVHAQARASTRVPSFARHVRLHQRCHRKGGFWG